MTRASTNPKTNLLAQDHIPVPKLLLHLALPTILAQLINMLYNVVDRMFIGRIPEVGSLALTGVGLTLPILMGITAFSTLVAAGGAPRASIAEGQQKREEASRILSQCFFLLLFLSLILTALIEIFSTQLLQLFGTSAQTLPYAQDYIQTYAWGTLFAQISLGLNTFITAQGRSRIAMITVFVGAFTNIVLDPLLIFGLGWGVRGAALATVLSQALSAVFVLHFFLKGSSIWRINIRDLCLRSSVLLPCLALGISPFVMNFTEAVLSASFNTQLQKFGGDWAVSSMTILSSLMMIYIFPIIGLTQGSQPLISFNYGAQNTHRVRSAVRWMTLYATGYSLIFWLLAQLFPRTLISLFTNNEALIQSTVTPLRIYFAVVLLMGFQMAFQNTFVALGVATTSLFLACLRKIILLIPLIFLFPRIFNGSVLSIFTAEPVADFLSVLITVLLFLLTFPKRLKKEVHFS